MGKLIRALYVYLNRLNVTTSILICSAASDVQYCWCHHQLLGVKTNIVFLKSAQTIFNKELFFFFLSHNFPPLKFLQLLEGDEEKQVKRGQSSTQNLYLIMHLLNIFHLSVTLINGSPSP